MAIAASGCPAAGVKPPAKGGGAAAAAPVNPVGPAPAPVLSPDDVAARGVPVAVIKTERGTFRAVLFAAATPKTVANFVDLVSRGFYNGLTFHHVVPGMLAETGDPRGDGSGGPGYQIPAEASPHRHLAGALVMARRAAPDTAGSQFYVCVQALPDLDGTATVFGQVTEGMDVVDALRKGDRVVEIRLEWVAPDTVPAELKS